MLAGLEAKSLTHWIFAKVVAVLTGGWSCNQATEQFGVAVSTAIGWLRRQRETVMCRVAT